jgi:hypothetical protein
MRHVSFVHDVDVMKNGPIGLLGAAYGNVSPAFGSFALVFT